MKNIEKNFPASGDFYGATCCNNTAQDLTAFSKLITAGVAVDTAFKKPVTPVAKVAKTAIAPVKASRGDAKSSSSLPMYLAIGGGVLLVILLIAIPSGGSQPQVVVIKK